MEAFVFAGIVFCVVFVGTLAILCSDSLEPKQKEDKAEEASEFHLRGDLANRVYAGKDKGLYRKHLCTLDALYADEHDMWVCPMCETLNKNETHCCAACGKAQIAV